MLAVTSFNLIELDRFWQCDNDTIELSDLNDQLEEEEDQLHEVITIFIALDYLENSNQHHAYFRDLLLSDYSRIFRKIPIPPPEVA